ncbi:MAG: phosphatase PAP2 family protein [Planctomycetota bacterium]|jgi:membrane-associated phospholipid phosphatase
MLYAGTSLPNVFLLLAAGVVVAMLRVTSMAHHPSDVFSGAAVGSLSAWGAVYIDKNLFPLKPPLLDLKPNLARLAIVAIMVPVILSEGIKTLVAFVFGSLLVGVFVLAGLLKKPRQAAQSQYTVSNFKYKTSTHCLKNRS